MCFLVRNQVNHFIQSETQQCNEAGLGWPFPQKYVRVKNDKRAVISQFLALEFAK
jgi:hypothetical protein